MNNIITATFNQVQVSFTEDAFLNATAIAKSFGKMPKDYLKTVQTKEYIKALAQHLTTRTKILVKENQLVRVQNGGNDRGTWLHPKLAVHFARWLSAEFAVWCDEQIEKILYNRQSTAKQREVLIMACDKLAINNSLRSDVYKSVANHFGYDKPVNMPVDILPQAIAYVYEELLAQEKARKADNFDYDMAEIIQDMETIHNYNIKAIKELFHFSCEFAGKYQLKLR